MKATKEIVEKRVVEALSATPIKEFTVDKSLEAYALYNALVGTTFDAESYKTLVEDEVGVQYLYDHIPGGAKLVKVDTTPSTNDTKNPDGQTKNSEENKDESDDLKDYTVPFKRPEEIHKWLEENNINDDEILSNLFSKTILLESILVIIPL